MSWTASKSQQHYLPLLWFLLLLFTFLCSSFFDGCCLCSSFSHKQCHSAMTPHLSADNDRSTCHSIILPSSILSIRHPSLVVHEASTFCFSCFETCNYLMLWYLSTVAILVTLAPTSSWTTFSIQTTSTNMRRHFTTAMTCWPKVRLHQQKAKFQCIIVRLAPTTSRHMVVRLFRELSFFELHLVQQPLATTKKACVTAGSSIQTAANDNFNGGDVVPVTACRNWEPF